ncbi:MAG: ECF transporter S component [Clostridiaceae bacterium]|nr:ECF transporter S component [Clostridiaceae bacterium]
MGKNTKKYIITGLMTAFVFALTFVFHIPVPYTSGYIHLGDSMIYLSVIILGPFFGAFASGIGSMLADLLAGYAHYAVPTLIIKSVMAIIMGLLLSGRTKKAAVASVLSSLAVWIAFSAGSIIYLKNQIAIIGKENLVNSLSGTDADLETIQQTSRIIDNFPVYLTAGLAVLIITLSVLSYFISKRGGNDIFNMKAIFGMSGAGMCMVIGYFIVESFMYSPIAALMSVPMNMIQFFAGVTAAGIFMPAIKKARLYADRQ